MPTYASVPLNLTIKAMEDHHLALSFALRVILAFNQCDHHHRKLSSSIRNQHNGIIFKIKYFLLKNLFWNTFWIRVCKTNWINQYVFSVWKLNFDSVRLNKWRRHWETVHIVTEKYHSCFFNKKSWEYRLQKKTLYIYISKYQNTNAIIQSTMQSCSAANHMIPDQLKCPAALDMI